MKIDVSGLMNRRTDVIRFDYTFDPDHTDVPCVMLPPDVEIPEGGIRVTGTASNTLGYMMFKAHVTASYVTACARCLDEISAEIEFDLERMIACEKIHDDSHISDDGEWDGELDDVIYVTDARIIPDADVVEELSLELPAFLLCSDDCPGLCQKCGHRLKDGDCGCKEEKEINPKLAILKKLLENQE
jgi:uncharacterized protein